MVRTFWATGRRNPDVERVSPRRGRWTNLLKKHVVAFPFPVPGHIQASERRKLLGITPGASCKNKFRKLNVDIRLAKDDTWVGAVGVALNSFGHGGKLASERMFFQPCFGCETALPSLCCVFIDGQVLVNRLQQAFWNCLGDLVKRDMYWERQEILQCFGITRLNFGYVLWGNLYLDHHPEVSVRQGRRRRLPVLGRQNAKGT